MSNTREMKPYEQRLDEKRQYVLRQLEKVINSGLPCIVKIKLTADVGPDKVKEPSIYKEEDQFKSVDLESLRPEGIDKWKYILTRQDELEKKLHDMAEKCGELKDRNEKLLQDKEELMLTLDEYTKPEPEGPLASHDLVKKRPRLNIRKDRKKNQPLNTQEVWQVRRYIADGWQNRWIANKMRIGESTVSMIRHNKAFAHVPLEPMETPNGNEKERDG